MNEKWDRRFLELAQHVSQWSKDSSTQCGSVIARPDRTIASVGYNGFPRGCLDDPGLYRIRPLKYERVIHAEMNAILSANEPVRGCTLYTFPGPICNRCAAHIIQAGIIRVVYIQHDNAWEMKNRWSKEFPLAGSQMLLEVGIEESELSPWDDNVKTQ